ncbi:MAG: hypothetical protein K1X57_06995 [Gemmataceae bacterium]|nr:hypothetical protein [Gemmataceae bacterium]
MPKPAPPTSISQNFELTALLAKARQGDREAWDQVFALAYDAIRDRISKILGYDFPSLKNRHGVTSIANRLYEKLLVAWNSGVRPTTPKDFFGFVAFKTRMMLRDLAGRARRDKLRGVEDNGDSVILEELAVARTMSPAQLLSWTEFHEKVEQLLTPEEYQVFELRFYGGHTNAEIAEMLGKEPKPISRLWNSALEKFNDTIEPLEK